LHPEIAHDLQKRPDRHRQRRDRWIAQAEKDDRRHQEKLRQQKPAAAAAEAPRQQRHVERVDQGRPEKLDRVGRTDQSK